jgi:hypothetical protein
MVVALFHKLAIPGLAAAAAVVAGAFGGSDQDFAPAYDPPASKVEALSLAQSAAAQFDRADLNNDFQLDSGEYAMLAVVTAELARLNGFISVISAGRAETVALAEGQGAPLTGSDRAEIQHRALSDYAQIAGRDGRVTRDEFVGAQLELLSMIDADRDGALSGAELAQFAAYVSRLTPRQS